MPETNEHKKLKEIISKLLGNIAGVSIQEYPSSGHLLDIMGVTMDGISIYIEIIWSSSFVQFQSDILMIHNSDADIKIIVGSSEVISNTKYIRIYSKTVISQRREGKFIHGEMLNGSKILEDSNYRITIMEIIKGLINQKRSSSEQNLTVTPSVTSIQDRHSIRLINFIYDKFVKNFVGLYNTKIFLKLYGSSEILHFGVIIESQKDIVINNYLISSSKLFFNFQNHLETCIKSETCRDKIIYNNIQHEIHIILHHVNKVRIFKKNILDNINSLFNNITLPKWIGEFEYKKEHFNPRLSIYQIFHYLEKCFKFEKYDIDWRIIVKDNQFILQWGGHILLQLCDSDIFYENKNKINNIIDYLLNNSDIKNIFIDIIKFEDEINVKHDYLVDNLNSIKMKIEDGKKLEGECLDC